MGFVHHVARHRKDSARTRPRDAWLFTQRFCGVCTTVHAMASVRAVEDALKLEIRSTPSTSAISS